MSDSPVAPVGDPEPAPPAVPHEQRNPPAAAVAAAKGDTSYVLLSENDDTGHWEHVDTVLAATGELAIREYLETYESPQGTFVAVASRHWKPVSPDVKVETVKTITLKAAS